MSATEYESSTNEDITLFETEAAKPKPAKKKKPMSEARRKQLLENLKKGRETSKLKRQQKAKLKKIEKEKESNRRQKIIDDYDNEKSQLKKTAPKKSEPIDIPMKETAPKPLPIQKPESPKPQLSRYEAGKDQFLINQFDRLNLRFEKLEARYNQKQKQEAPAPVAAPVVAPAPKQEPLKLYSRSRRRRY